MAPGSGPSATASYRFRSCDTPFRNLTGGVSLSAPQRKEAGPRTPHAREVASCAPTSVSEMGNWMGNCRGRVYPNPALTARCRMRPGAHVAADTGSARSGTAVDEYSLAMSDSRFLEGMGQYGRAFLYCPLLLIGRSRWRRKERLPIPPSGNRCWSCSKLPNRDVEGLAVMRRRPDAGDR